MSKREWRVCVCSETDMHMDTTPQDKRKEYITSKILDFTFFAYYFEKTVFRHTFV